MITQPTEKLKLIFAGTPEFAVPALQSLLNSPHQVCAVYTQPDRPVGRGRKLAASPVKSLALQAGLPVYQPQSLKTAEDLQQLQQFNADLMVVVAYGMILPQAVLESPRLGCLNIHASLLPRWRGAAPIQRAIMAGDAETGVTLMKIVAKLDAGDILQQQLCPILADDTAADLLVKLAHIGAETLMSVLQDLPTLTPQPQLESLVTYAYKLDKTEANLDWTQPALTLERQIRGLNPWPVAQTGYRNQVLRIWRAVAIDSNKTLAAGEISSDGRVMEIGTGLGILRLLEVQLPNAKRMKIKDFLNANAVNGQCLGEF